MLRLSIVAPSSCMLFGLPNAGLMIAGLMIAGDGTICPG